MEKHQVSIGWQVMATIFIPTGLYAFKRINKLRYGGLLYLGTFGFIVLFAIIFLFNITWFAANEIISFSFGMVGIVSYAIPMIFVAQLSKQYNEKLETKTSSQDAPKQI